MNRIRLPDPLPIEPLTAPFDIAITPPGSKSLTCRAYLLAALADGRSRIERSLVADDTERLLAAIETLGAEVRHQRDTVLIGGTSGRFPCGGSIDLGHGGAPTRFMIAAATLAAEPVTIDGSPRMRERPVGELLDLLRALGACIEHLGAPGCLPVRVVPSGRLAGGTLEIGATRSSQTLSALFLIAPHLREGLRLRFTAPITSRSYLLMTCELMRRWGVALRDPPPPEEAGGELRIEPQPLRGATCAIEPDASSATYWLTAAAITPGARARIAGLDERSVQPDARYVGPLRRMGAIAPGGPDVVAGGPPRLRGLGTDPGFDMSLMPDAAVTLAAAAALADGPSLITGLQTLRVKESDRLAALRDELGRIGCRTEITGSTILIDPAAMHDRPAVIRTYDDHRMAMAFAVLGLARPGISIEDPGCVSKSYPGFWDDLRRLAPT